MDIVTTEGERGSLVLTLRKNGHEMVQTIDRRQLPNDSCAQALMCQSVKVYLRMKLKKVTG